MPKSFLADATTSQTPNPKALISALTSLSNYHFILMNNSRTKMQILHLNPIFLIASTNEAYWSFPSHLKNDKLYHIERKLYDKSSAIISRQNKRPWL